MRSKLKRLLAWLLTPWRYTPPEPQPTALYVYGDIDPVLLMARWEKLHVGGGLIYQTADRIERIKVVDIGVRKP